MTAKMTETTDALVHSQNLQRELERLIEHTRSDIEKVNDPRFQALLETTAEVLDGLKTAYEHYDQKSERAWQSSSPQE